MGNIYASEILNYCQINPNISSCKIMINKYKKLSFIQKVLKYSIKRGGTTINNFYSIKGNQGNWQKEFRAYNRENKKCKNKQCIGTIIKLNISNRATYVCNFLPKNK